MCVCVYFNYTYGERERESMIFYFILILKTSDIISNGGVQRNKQKCSLEMIITFLLINNHKSL